MFVFIGKYSSDLSSLPLMVERSFVSLANDFDDTQFGPNLLVLFAERPDLIRPYYTRGLESTGIGTVKVFANAVHNHFQISLFRI